MKTPVIETVIGEDGNVTQNFFFAEDKSTDSELTFEDVKLDTLVRAGVAPHSLNIQSDDRVNNDVAISELADIVNSLDNGFINSK